MYNAGLDIATEEFAPLNCRKLITIMLSINDKYHDGFDLYKRIIELSWPEVLQLPLTTTEPYVSMFIKSKLKIKNKLMSSGMMLLKKVGQYDNARNWYRKILYRIND